ncbi:MAG: DUF302 domain-containing protein [Candidatus Coatesbacteria bacterium]|nr:MAG: DUF302 domain-containing protein [Candidatus Coatesbacteria bacterium]
MSYYFAKTLDVPAAEAEERVREALAQEGFGVLTEIDVQATLRKKLDVDFRPYKILGACHPPSAFAALQAEDKIGLMLPCNVVVQELPSGEVEVAAIDPLASMAAVDNPSLAATAEEVRRKLQEVIESL